MKAKKAPFRAASLTTPLLVTVYGDPAPQGSKNPFPIKGGRIVLVEASKKLKPWRNSVIEAVRAEVAKRSGGIKGPVVVDICFTMHRPKAAKDREEHFVKPDLDKLTRAIGDALTQGGAIEDDSRIVAYGHNAKRYVGNRKPHTLPTLDRPGVVIRVTRASSFYF